MNTFRNDSLQLHGPPRSLTRDSEGQIWLEKLRGTTKPAFSATRREFGSLFSPANLFLL